MGDFIFAALPLVLAGLALAMAAVMHAKARKHGGEKGSKRKLWKK